jgi:hypothetical protein
MPPVMLGAVNRQLPRSTTMYDYEDGDDCPDHGPYADDDCPKCESE